MATAHDMVGGTVTAVFNGREWILSRPNLAVVYSEMQGILESRELENIRRAADVFGLVGTARAEFLALRHSQIPTGPELAERALREMGTVDGLSRMLYMVTRDNMPDVTQEECTECVVADPETVGSVLVYLSGHGKGKKKPAAIKRETAKSGV